MCAARVRLGVGLVGLLLAPLVVSCGSSGRGPTPVFVTSRSVEATQSFEEVRDAWERRDVEPRLLLKLVERHLKRFPKDGSATTAKLYLVFTHMQLGDFYAADAQLSLLMSEPSAVHPGPEADMLSVARAKSLRHRGDNQAALDLLRPLVGKAVDETVRGIFLEELTLASLGSGDDYEAIAYMDAWLRGVSEDKREASRAKIAKALEAMPAGVIEATYRAMRAQAGSGYSSDIQRLVAARLAKIAIQNEDPQLARWLLDVTPGGADAFGDAGPHVLELAASRRGLREVQGRTIGLLLPIREPELRDAAASVLRGVSWALELPKPAGERRDAVRLVVRNDAGGAGDGGSDLAMEELFGEGAAVIIAGLDGPSADRALRWGERHGMPVILLHPPEAEPLPDRAGYVVGESREAQVSVLARALAGLSVRAAQVISSSPAKGRSSLDGALSQGGLTKAFDAVGCDLAPPRPGLPRFPITAWAKADVSAFVVAGPRDCLSDVISELKIMGARRTGAPPFLAATLDAEIPDRAAHTRFFTVGAGVLPIVAAKASDIGDPEVLAFYNELGHAPSWWAALARDAGILARQAVSALPANTTANPDAIAQRHAIVASALGRAKAPLWTTEAPGFEGGHVLARTLRAVEMKRD